MTLLEKIQSRIAYYGGNERLADYIEAEWVKEYVRRKVSRNDLKSFSDTEMDYIRHQYSEVTGQHIAFKLKRSGSSVRDKINRMQKEGQLTYKLKRFAKRIDPPSDL